MTTATPEDGTLQRLLDDEIEPFLQHLRAARYSEETLQRKRGIAREFARWAQQNLIAAGDLSSSDATAFIARLPQRAKTRVALERATVSLFLEHLCTRGGLRRSPKEDGAVQDGYPSRYEDYLRNDRGLAANSIHVYVPFIRSFLSVQTIQAGRLSQDAFDTLCIRNFLVAQTKGRSGEYTRLLATSLRSFFRFLFFTAETDRDLSSSVPMVRKYRMSVPPSFLSFRLRGKTTSSKADGGMPRFLTVAELFKGRHFDREIAILCVRCNLRTPRLLAYWIGQQARSNRPDIRHMMAPLLSSWRKGRTR